MTWEIILLTGIMLLVVLILSGVWIAFALGLTGVLLVFISGKFSMMPGIGYTAWTTANSFVLTAVPLFILMGELMINSGLDKGFYRGVSLWTRFLPGKLLQANVATCAIFAAISGSSVVTAATISKVAYPELERQKYDPAATTGSLAAGGTLGILIPPSIPLIVYGDLASESVAKLFMAGVIPGIILASIFSLFIMFQCVRNPNIAPRYSMITDSWKKEIRYTLSLIPFGLVIGIILGGIYTGVMTPTEAAAIGAFITFLLVVIHREFSWRMLGNVLVRTLQTTCMIMFLVVGAQVLQYGFAVTGVTRELAAWVMELNLPVLGTLIVIYVMYIILGSLMDGLSMILLTLPVVLPILVSQGINLTWFAIVLVVLIELGALTPPVGLNLFVLKGVTNKPLSVVIKGSLPYCVLLLIMVVILTAFPNLALWLPQHMR